MFYWPLKQRLINKKQGWGKFGGLAKSVGFRQEPQTTRGNRRDRARKSPNCYQLGIQYWWRMVDHVPTGLPSL